MASSPLARKPLLLSSTLSLPPQDTTRVQSFHASLPAYKPTPLVPLPSLAKSLNIANVLLKDESNRLGLPAFKVLGASYGAFRAVCSTFALDHTTTSFDDASRIAKENAVTFFTASEGNHGRALAKVAALMGISARIYVSHTVHPATVATIEAEGADVVVCDGDYDFAVATAHAAAAAAGRKGIFVQDASFDGYHDIPAWIVEGYSTLLAEVGVQVAELGLGRPTAIVTPVGVGSLAHAVVRFAKRQSPSVKVVAVEPDTAACLYKSVAAGTVRTVKTGRTIMGGCNCGTPSLGPFEELRQGVDACVTVSDLESHSAVRELDALGFSSGPCGAGTMAALKRLAGRHRPEWLDKDAVVVLLNTEGRREYDTPADVASDNETELATVLGGIGAVEERDKALATYLFSWLEHRDVETHWIEQTPGVPTVVGILRGTGSGEGQMIHASFNDAINLSSTMVTFLSQLESVRMSGTGSERNIVFVAGSQGQEISIEIANITKGRDE